MDELKILWSGRTFVNAIGQTVLVRAALLCGGSDIPATRKLGGFVGHQATKGCSKCTLSFPTENFGKKPDHSNFNRSEWENRSNDKHREEICRVQHTDRATKD